MEVLAWLAASPHRTLRRPPGCSGTPPLTLKVCLDAVAAVGWMGCRSGAPAPWRRATEVIGTTVTPRCVGCPRPHDPLHPDRHSPDTRHQRTGEERRYFLSNRAGNSG